MSKEMDEIRGKIETMISMALIDSIPNQHDITKQILSLETPALRIAVVRKDGELPKTLAGPDNINYCAGYYDAKQDILNAGYVQEVL